MVQFKKNGFEISTAKDGVSLILAHSTQRGPCCPLRAQVDGAPSEPSFTTPAHYVLNWHPQKILIL